MSTKLSRIYFSCPENVRKNDQIWCPEFFHAQKTGQILDMKKIPEKFSGHIPDIQKIWTKSGQINWTKSGHEKFQKFFPDIFWTWKNFRQILDKWNWTNSRHKKFWTNSGQIKLDKFWTWKIPEDKEKFWTYSRQYF